MTEMYLPVVFLEIPDDEIVVDVIRGNVETPGTVVIAKVESQYDLYVTQPDDQNPWRLYADLGQHFHAPDVLVSSPESPIDKMFKMNGDVIGEPQDPDDLLEECECATIASRAKELTIDDLRKQLEAAKGELKDRLDPEFVLKLAGTINSSAKGGMV